MFDQPSDRAWDVFRARVPRPALYALRDASRRLSEVAANLFLPSRSQFLIFDRYRLSQPFPESSVR